MNTRDIKDIARALVGVAREQNVLPDVVRDMAVVGDVLMKNQQLIATLGLEHIAVEDRMKIVKDACREQIHPFVIHAVGLLMERELLREVGSCAALVEEMAANVGFYLAHVTVSTELTATERKQLTAHLEKLLGGTVQLDERMDASLLGGFCVDVAGRRMDASTRGAIHRLTQSLVTTHA